MSQRLRRSAPASSNARPIPGVTPAGMAPAGMALAGLALLLALVVSACSGAAGGSQAAVSIDPNAPSLIAHGLMFDKDQLDVPSGQAFELILNNDDGVPHNIAIYADEAHTQVIFRGDLESTGIHVYDVPALAPGTYYFQCDVHPQMHGIVVAGPG